MAMPNLREYVIQGAPWGLQLLRDTTRWLADQSYKTKIARNGPP